MGHNDTMRLFDTILRVAALVAVIWLLVLLVMPSPDPFLIAVGSLVVVALTLAVRRIRHWVLTGRLRPTKD